MTPSLRPFQTLGSALRPAHPLRDAITRATRRDEALCMQDLLPQAMLPEALREPVHELALSLAQALRDRKAGMGREGRVQALMQEFSLSTQEGVSLMCLAEALLRIPDEATRDALIRDKIGDGNWAAHLGHSPSLFVNAATWGLLLTGRLVSTHGETGLTAALKRAAIKGGEPVIRKAVDVAMRMLGEQFVIGERMDRALEHARTQAAQGFRHSFDMLGEAALTAADAQRYARAYADAIHAIGQTVQGRTLYEASGISIKLSALHPRYARSQYTRVMDELYPRLLELVQQACRYNIGINIDAEESERLELSLDLLERLCREPSLQHWDGIGFVVQAYQKRCPEVLDHLIDLARQTGHRLMVRLVKGAYWDSEIKRAQQEGQRDYPVYTRKAHTDVAYIACARKLLDAPAEIYPQFATHNAQTLAAIYHLAGPDFNEGRYEFQCLHGMGEALYERVVSPVDEGGLGRPCRIYAPVGSHDTLLPYLVRRLLENGANSSFVHQVADASLPLDTLVADPVTQVAMAPHPGSSHPAIPLPAHLYSAGAGPGRLNSPGTDLNDEHTLAALHAELTQQAALPVHGCPLLATVSDPLADDLRDNLREPVRNPADRRDTVGTLVLSSEQDIEKAVRTASRFAPVWRRTPVGTRAALLEAAAQAFASHQPELINLLVREAGKTLANAVGEIREAIDFLRYYAAQARGDLHDGRHDPLGVVVCISPWNFPLAIFTGQIAAALAAGNTVLAKPAEQTSLMAWQAVMLMHAAGIPREALQLLPGRGETVGAALVSRPEVSGVMFTGSTQVARLLASQLAMRVTPRGTPPVLIAETGGQNAMIVDSSALPEQVVNDVMASAFDSAGQRCSALRVLCLQHDIADKVIEMLQGAMAQWQLGPTDRLSTDIGPLIDQEALQTVELHVETLRACDRRVFQPERALAAVRDHGAGCFLAPTLIELHSLQELVQEVFGPVLHIIRYERAHLDRLLDDIHATGYGLTLGVHSRIDETIEAVVARARVGNVYVNRNMIGAVVGVQPFGGQGLSGTGPKAGGPLYLHRLLHATAPAQGNAASLRAMAAHRTRDDLPPVRQLRDWLSKWPMPHATALLEQVDWLLAHSPVGHEGVLPGPTGERNTYRLRPRGPVLCVAAQEADLLYQLATALAMDCRAVWAAAPSRQPLLQALPPDVRARIDVVPDLADATWHGVLMHGSASEVITMAQMLADRPGPLIPLQALPPGWRQPGGFSWAPLMHEQCVSVNTAAAGGNASLMTLAADA
ncbi:MAG: trifunctional transcriptional regulator/proline dehydrogenase/L-glutamate gamma-semialdehyde dehydrogenase [Aquabacterium sp.]